MAVHPNSRKNLQLWKAGQSGNPGGKPPCPPELKAIQALSRLELCRIVSKYSRMTLTEFEQAWVSADTPVIHLCVISLLKTAREDGDHTPLAWLLDRAIGKVQEHGPAEQEDDAERRKLENLSEEELLELAKKKIAELEATA